MYGGMLIPLKSLASMTAPALHRTCWKRIGEPYLSRRPTAEDAQSERSGLGLGVFIARTLLERTAQKSPSPTGYFRSRRRGYRPAARRVRGWRNRQ